MAVGRITRREEFVSVYVADRLRRFRLRAHSVAGHLELMEVRQKAYNALPEQVASVSEALRWWAQAHMESTCTLLSHPADGGEPLTEEEFWDLEPAEVMRLEKLQEKLTNAAGALGEIATSGAAPSLDEIAINWLEIGTAIARARMAPDPTTPLNGWSLEQCVNVYHLACRELWRETAFRIRLVGGDPGREPQFGARAGVVSAERQQAIEQGFDAMKEAYYEKNRDPEGRKFPGTL